MTKQKALDDYALQRAKNKRQKAFNRNVKQRPADDRAVASVAQDLMPAIGREIEDWLSDSTGRRGPKSSAAMLLYPHDPDLMAHLTCREVLNHLIAKTSLTTCALRIGAAIEDEAMMAHFKRCDVRKFRWVEKECRRRRISGYQHQRAFFRKVLKDASAKDEIPSFDWWSIKQRGSTGFLLIKLFCVGSGVATLKLRKNARSKERYLEAHPGLLKLVAQRLSDDILMPECLPMVEKPRPWVDLEGGGYDWGSVVSDTQIVRSTGPKVSWGVTKGVLKDASLGPTMAALNAIQETGYRINRPVLEVMREVWSRGLEIGKLPSNRDVDMPPAPAEMSDPEFRKTEAAKVYRKKARNAHDENRARMSQRLTVERILALAKLFEKEGALYFPHNLDFRGRFYSLPSDLQPQGVEFARGLLEFSEGKKVETDQGLKWLMVHGANCYGEDKGSFDDRIAWVKANLPSIRRVARSPLGPKTLEFWSSADKPFMFLAWCFDYVGTLAGEPSRVAISMDGSCNGLQHFAAMLRDPIAAQAVNLAPSEKPQDIYQEVADVVVAKLKTITEGKEAFWAREFLAAGIDRKVCKRAVMVMPYGGTLNATKRYVEEVMVPKLPKDIFGDDLFVALHFLATTVHRSTRDVVKSAEEAMDYLQTLAKAACQANKDLVWVSPSGFPVVQRYRKSSSRVVETALHGKFQKSRVGRIQYRINEPTDKRDNQKSINGVSPNFVHSLDAAALCLTVNRLSDRVTHVMMVHDDYGTHAADAHALEVGLRAVFAELYSENNILMEFKEQVRKLTYLKLPDPPAQGSFNVNLVRESDYFFA